MQGTAGGAGDGEFIDNIFKTHLYYGTGQNAHNVITGIDMSASGQGGMVYIKNRTENHEHIICDTVRGVNKNLIVNSSSGQGSGAADSINYFNNNGFGFDNSWSPATNKANNYTSSTFIRSPGFFDVVTYTGNGATNREISHNLEGLPGFIILKRTDSSAVWLTASIRNDASQYEFCLLNSANAKWSNDLTANVATASVFKVNSGSFDDAYFGGDGCNINGATYVCYLFANNDERFGDKGNNSVIKCGQYTGNGSSNGPDVNLGWEPQWLLVKRSNAAEDWMLFDHMRTSERQDMWLDELRLNQGHEEYDGAGGDSQPFLNWTSTGFKLSSNTTHTNGNGDTYNYVAIRRPDGYVGKLPTAGSQVFTPVADSSGAPMFKTPNHYVDMSLQKNSNYASSTATWNIVNRLRSKERLETQSNIDEQYNQYHTFDYQFGESNYTGGSGVRFSWNWKRYAGFDMVHYTGSNSTRSLAHSLNRVPELIIIKKLNTAGNWIVGNPYLTNWNYVLYLNMINAQDNASSNHFSSAPTSTHINLGNHGNVNGATWIKYLALLFASVDGISKVGSYTGTGYDLTVTTGFSPRFVLIKRTDSDENWFVLDTVRGWASGNDQYLILNSTAQQASADFGNPVASGFLVKGTSSGSNTSGGTYIYYAHA